MLHKNLIKKSLFFDIVFGTQFSKGKDGEMWLQDETPENKTLFIQYLYRQKIPEGHSQQYLDSLYELYIFAEKIYHEKLMDATIDAIRFTSHKFEKLIDEKTLLLVYQNTLEGSGLRKFAHTLFVYGLYRQHKKVIRTELFCDLMVEFTKNGKFMVDPRSQEAWAECFGQCHDADDPCGMTDEEPVTRYWIDDHGRKTSKSRKIVEKIKSEEDNYYVNQRKRQRTEYGPRTMMGRGSGSADMVNGLVSMGNEDGAEQSQDAGGEQSQGVGEDQSQDDSGEQNQDQDVDSDRMNLRPY
jgi:hypothetical protein